MWFHPENLYAEWPRLENVVARFLEDLGVLARSAEVRCLTMGQLADEFQTKLAVARDRVVIPTHAETACVDCASQEAS